MGHPGTYVNGPTLGVTGLVTADANTAVEFDNTAQSHVAQNDTFAAQTLTAFTLGCIIKPNDPTNNQAPQFWGIDSNNFSLDLGTTSGVGGVWFRFAPAGGFSGFAAFGGTTVMSAGTTYRIIATWDGTTAKLYVNGALDGGVLSGGGGSPVSGGSPNAYNGGSLPFGPASIVAGGGTGAWLTDAPAAFYAAADVFNIYPGGTFDGTVDECFFVANHAATTGEVATIDAAATGTGSIVSAINALSPYIYWRLGESAGTTAADSASTPVLTFPSVPTVAYMLDTPSVGAADGYLVLDDATHGKLDTGTLAIYPLYVDFATSLRHLTFRRGSDDPSDALFRANTGTCTGTFDNRTRVFDPLSSTDIEPMRPMQVVATWNSVDYELFTGFVQSWDLNYPAYAKDATTTAHAVDGTARLVNLTVTDPLLRQTTGARIRRLLDDCGWAAGMSIAAGLTEMPGHIGTVSGVSAAFEAADSEMGDLYVQTDGTMRFFSRDEIITRTRSIVSQATFGDSGAELPYHDVSISYDDSRIRNQITVTYNEDGDSVEVRDADSIAAYGFKNYSLQVSMVHQAEARSLAWFLLHLYRNPLVRVDGITLKPRADPTNLWPAVLGRELGDRLTVKLTPPGGGSRISQEVFLRGIEYDIDNDLDWTVQFTLQDASLFYSPFVLDTSHLDSTTDLLWL